MLRKIQKPAILLAFLLMIGACDRDRPSQEAGTQANVTTPIGAMPVASVVPDTALDPRLVGDSDDRDTPAQDPVTPPAAPPSRDPAPPPPAPQGAPSAASGATSATSEDATAILLRAERAYEATQTLQATFIQDLTVPMLGSSQRSRGEIFHRKPDRFLMRFSDPAGDIVVADGQYVWMYYPSSDPRQVIRTTMGQVGRLDLQREFLSNPTERFTATLGASEQVDGRAAREVTLVPREASPYRQVRIWVDARDGLVRRFEITETNDAVRRLELHDLRVNATLADDLFSFTPPASAQVFDQ